MIAGDAHSIAYKIAAQIIESGRVELDAPYPGEKPRRGGGRERAVSGRSSRPKPGEQGAVHRHGLCGIFYAARNSEATVGAKRVVGRAMRRSAAADASGIPFEDFVEQTHAPPMRNVMFDPGSI